MGRLELILIVSAGLVLMGVYILAKGHQEVVHTVPLIEVVPSTLPDQSTIQNEIQSLNTIASNRAMASAPPTPIQ